MIVFLKGLLLGLSIAAPVGPIGVLCIRRTLGEGRLAGFLSGLGAASADMLYGAIAAFGLTTIQELLLGQVDWLKMFGGLFLLYLGTKTFLAKPAAQEARIVGKNGMLTAYLSTFLLTLTNPITILSFIAIFAGLQLGDENGNYLTLGLLVIGVFCGSAAWWLTLSFVVGQLRGQLDASWLVWVNRASGVIILGFGIAALLMKTTS